jgi:hypothetical protein
LLKSKSSNRKNYGIKPPQSPLLGGCYKKRVVGKYRRAEINKSASFPLTRGIEGVKKSVKLSKLDILDI